MLDKALLAVSVILLSFMVMMMWGKQERFDEKVSWCEDQILQIKGARRG